jgi:hypothetical protein
LPPVEKALGRVRKWVYNGGAVWEM